MKIYYIWHTDGRSWIVRAESELIVQILLQLEYHIDVGEFVHIRQCFRGNSDVEII